MTSTTENTPRPGAAVWQFVKDQRVWAASAAILLLLALFDPAQSADSAAFAGTALAHTAPYLLFSIAVAAWAGATGADNLVAKAFTGSPLLMIALGALAGGLSPFWLLRGDPADCSASVDGRAAVRCHGLLAGLADHGPFDVLPDRRGSGG